MLGLKTSDIKNIARFFFPFSTRLLSYGKRVYMYHLVAECCFRAGALEAFNNFFFFLVSALENLREFQDFRTCWMSAKVIRNVQYRKIYIKNIQAICYNENMFIKIYSVMYTGYSELPINAAAFRTDPNWTFLLQYRVLPFRY